MSFRQRAIFFISRIQDPIAVFLIAALAVIVACIVGPTLDAYDERQQALYADYWEKDHRD
jgi:hypothetical protein